MQDQDNEKIEQLANMINDLTLSLEMWLDGYQFDDFHKAKQRKLIDYACVLIGKPRTIDELKKIIKETKSQKLTTWIQGA